MEKNLVFYIKDNMITPQEGVEVIKRPEEQVFRVYATDKVALNLYEKYKDYAIGTTPHLRNLKNFPTSTQLVSRFSQEAK